MKRILWFLEFLLLVLVTLPIAILPYRVSLKVGEALGRLLFFLWAGRRKIAIENPPYRGVRSLSGLRPRLR
jgi:lauroyl/myristoyl acyltransferase